MVSRRIFLSITLMMATLFFLFQFSQVVKEQENKYETNEYVHGVDIGMGDYWGPESVHFASGDFVVYVGSKENGFYGVVEQWCRYTKRNLVCLSSMAEFSAEDGIKPEVVFINAERMFMYPEVPIARRYAQREGISFVLANLPSPGVLEQSKMLMEFMGISEVVENEVALSGVHLFGGFLLGGETIYKVEEKDKDKQDLDFTIPWYRIGYNTKTFMMGMLDEDWAEQYLRDKEAEEQAAAEQAGVPASGTNKGKDAYKLSNEELPAIIWRNSVGSGKVYSVNGDYMQGVLGMGILSSIMADLKTYELYPVVNAQNVTVANMGGFSRENQSRLNAIYSRDQAGILQNIILPDMRAMMEQCGAKPTYCLSPQYDYEDDVFPVTDNYTYYMQQIKEHRGEAGWSLEAKRGTSMEKKIREDSSFLGAANNQYEYSAFYMSEELQGQIPQVLKDDAFASMRTVSVKRKATGEEKILYYYDDRITVQNITNYAEKHTYMDDLQLKAVQTALGYSNTLIDMNMILWPTGVSQQWELLGEQIARNLDTYWSVYNYFDATTLSESDARLRTFLNMDYVQERSGNVITIGIIGTSEKVWFILRTHGEKIASIQGGTYKKIEENVYLICAQSSEVKLNLRRK